MISLNILTTQVKDVLAYSQDCENEDTFKAVRPLIDQWWENKRRFFEIFNESLIWEGPFVSIDYNQDIKIAMFNNFISKAVDYLADRTNHLTDWVDWIEVNSQGFFDNVVIEPLPDTNMKQGMKLIKAFKFFDFPTEVTRYLQDLASQIIQKNKIEGILCLSIHPLDYLSISDNNANWRSCHALDGEYRAGDLSYMLDKSTIVCYIKSKEDVQLERFPDGLLWNNKKWRVLLHCHKDNNIAYVNRQYPFSSSDLIYKLMETAPMRQMGFDDKRSYYQNEGFRNIGDRELSQNYFMIHGIIVDPMEFCAGDKNSLQYNDFVFSPHYTPQYIMGSNKYFFFTPSKEGLRRDFVVPIGVKVPCPCCGKNLLSDSGGFFCDYCLDDKGYIGDCEGCGIEIYEGDAYSVVGDGHLYCEACRDPNEAEMV